MTTAAITTATNTDQTARTIAMTSQNLEELVEEAHALGIEVDGFFTTLPTLRAIQVNIIKGQIAERKERLATQHIETLVCPQHGEQKVWVKNGSDVSTAECPECAKIREEKEKAKKEVELAAMVRFHANSKRLIDFLNRPLPSPYEEGKTFANYTVGGTKEQAKALLVAQRFATTFKRRMIEKKPEERKLGLLMCGKYGTGKSHLASAIVNEVKTQGFEPFCVTALTLFNLYRPAANLDPNALNAHLSNCPLLLVDEIGRTTGSDFERNQLLELLDERARKGYPTILITNLGIKGLSEYFGGALESRAQTLFYPLSFTWGDYRGTKRADAIPLDELFV